MIRKYIQLFIVFLFVAGSFSRVSATHIVGGALTYKFNGVSTYTVTLQLYRDCCPTCAAAPGFSGQPLPVVNFRYANGTNFTTPSITLNYVSTSSVTATLPPCATAPASPPCVEEYIYTNTFTATVPPGGLHLYYSFCCRNQTLTNTTTNPSQNPGDGETFYAFIPAYASKWVEDFNLANGTTSDAGATAWTRTLGGNPPTSAQVNNGQFEVTASNSSKIWLENFTLANGTTNDAGPTAWTSTVLAGAATAQVNGNLFEFTGGTTSTAEWSSGVINIAAYTEGINLAAAVSEPDNLEATDNITIAYSLNGGPRVNFATNGSISNDFGAATASSTGIIGNTIQIFVTATNDASGAGERYRLDDVRVWAYQTMVWSSAVIPINTYTAGVNLSVNLAETGTLEATDNIKVQYSLNGGAPVNFATNGSMTDDFASAFAYTTGLVGNTIQILITTSNDTVSSGEVYSFDMVSVYENSFLSNNSPTFNSLPPLYVCAVNSFTVTSTATDSDGDSLAYVMYTPYSDLAISYVDNVAVPSDIIWNAGYSATSPFNSGGPSVTLSSTTGVMTGVGNTTGQYVFGIKVREYRNGILLSEVVRDYQANMVTCPPFVPATPTASVVNTGPVCTGQNLSLTASSTDPSPTFSWTGPNGFTSTLQSPVIGAVTTAASGTYSVVSTVTGCNSAAGTLTVTVNVTPTAPTAGSNSPVCVGSTISLTATSTGSTYSWNGPNSYTSTSQNPTFTASSTNYAGTYSVNAISAAGCISTAGTTSVSVSLTPSAPTPGSNSPVCSGNTLSLTASTTGTSYNWTGPNSFTSTDQNPTIGAVTTLASGTYSVNSSTGGCTSSSATVSVTINQTPSAPTAGSNSPVCAGNTVSLTASAAGTSYSWTGPNSYTANTQNPTFVAGTTAYSGTYSVTATTAGCTGPAGTTSVTVNPGPSAPTAGSNSPVCAGNTVSLTSTTVPGATYSWTGPNSFTSTLEDPTIAAATTAASGSYTISATVAGCTPVTAVTSVTVNPGPAAPTLGSNSPICSGNTLSLTSSTVTNANYSWTGPNSFTSTLEDPTIAAATSAATGTYTLVATVPGCTPVNSTIAATVNQTPAAPAPGSNSPVCSGNTLSLTASSTGTTYAWTGPNSFTSTSQNPTIGAATTAASGTYTVSTTTGSCTSPTATVAVTVNQTPSAPTAGSNSPVCAGNTLSLTASAAGTSYNWNGPNSYTANTQNPTFVAGTTAYSGTYSVTATTAGCTGPAGTVSVTVNPGPGAPVVGSNSPICAGSTLSLTSSTITGASAYDWAGPNSFTSSLQNPTIGAATTAATGTYTLTVTVPGCGTVGGTVSATVNPIPSAPTAGSNSPICAGNTISLTASATGTSYNWTGPNSFTSTTQNPTIPAAGTAYSGTYSVTATANGCTGSAGTVAVTVNPIPAAPATASGSPNPVCSGQDLTLTTAFSAGATYNWTGPNSFTASVQSPVISGVTIAAAGTYSVSYTISGCTGPVQTFAQTVNQTPAAPVAGSNSPICVGINLNLTASATGTTYNWNGPNSYTSTAQNPTIAAAGTANSGTYSVTATTAGCTSPAGTVSVTVNPPPSAPTLGSNSPVCSGQTLSLTSTTLAGGSYSWSGPNGFTSTLEDPTIGGATVAATGTYSMTASVAGCPPLTTQTISVTINATPAVPTAGSNSPACLGGDISLTANGTGISYSWSGPNSFTSASQNPVINGATTSMSGTYSVNTTSAAGCTSADGTVSVTVNPPPTNPVTGSNGSICTGQTASLTASNVPAANYAWTGPNGFTSAVQNPTFAANTTAYSGTYSVVATVPGCASSGAGTATLVVSLTPVAPAAGSNSPVCVGQDLSLTANGAGPDYSWTGPNGFTSTSQNPALSAVTSAEAGTYNVTTTTAAGCTSPAGSTVVTVNPIPAAPVAGSNSPVCSGNNLNLTASATGTSYAWTGPNSFTSAAQNPTIVAITTAGSGTYSVVATALGCTGPAGTVSVTVNQTPAAPMAGSNSPICVGYDLSLTATSTGSTYNWTGPNGFTSTAQNPVLTGAVLASAGTYSVTASDNGCTGSAGTTAVTVNPSPSAPVAGSNSPVCEGNPINLTASLVGGTTYSWNGPNGFTSTAQNPSIAVSTTADAGTYSVSVTSIANGCVSSVSTTSVIVNPPPSAPVLGNNSPICSGQTLSLTSSTVTGASYAWSGPNSFTSSLQNPTIGAVTTAASGTYSMTATVPGCPPVATQTTSVTINQTPAAPVAGSNSPACAGNDISLTASSTGATYNWSGPAGFTSTTQDPVISPATTAMAGTYSVVAVSAAGCVGPAGTVAVIVNPAPNTPVPGSNSPICSGQTLSLTANTIAAATYNWTGPNGFTSTSQNPTIGAITVAGSGTYSVTATVPGCGTTAAGTASVTVNPTPAAPVAGSNSPICSGNDLSLTASTVGGSTYAWTGPGGYTSNVQDPVIVAATTANSGTYSVVATENGCTGPAGTVSVTINGIPAAPVASNNGPLCVGDNLVLSASLIPGAVYNWSGPNGFTSAVQNPGLPAVTTAEAGTYSVNVTLAGCQGPTAATTVVIAPPPAAPTLGSNSPICSGFDLSLTANTTVGATYNWSGPNGFTSTLEDPTITAVTTAASGTYTMIITIGSCTSPQSTVPVTVDPAPATPVVSSNSPVCLGGNLSLTASTIPNVSYNWIGPNGYTSTAQNPVISNVTTADGGTYVANVISTTNGCSSQNASVAVVISTPATANAGSDQTVCANNPVSLNGSVTGGAGTGIWTTPNGSGPFTPNNTTLNATYTPPIADTLVGNVLLILTTTNNGGCPSDADTAIVTVTPGPVVNAGADQSICSNNYSTVAINGTIQVATGGIWSSLGAGTFTQANTVLTNTYQPTAADVAAGSDTLVLTSTGNGTCNPVTDTLIIYFTPSPVVNAGADIPVCFGDTSALLNGSVSGGATTGQWSSLGTGAFSPNSTTLNATYYLSQADTAAGSVTLVLTSTGNGNCLAVTDTVVINMTPAPVVNAGSDQTVCANNDTVFLNGSVSSGATAGYWASSGTGTFLPDSSVLNGTYIPSAADTANGSVTLTLTSSNGCRPVADSLVVTITPAPVVNAGPDVNLCTPSPVALNGTVTAAATGGIWTSSGNGTFTPNNTALNATYNPGSNDTATVTLVLTSTGNGLCLAVSDSLVINFGSSPTAAFVYGQACSGQLVSFTDSSIVSAPDSIISWNWTIGGANDTLQNPTHTYVSAGTDTVTLVITTLFGCTDTVSQVIMIHPSPVAAFTYSIDCTKDTVYFTDLSTIAGGTITGWSWNFGDGNSSAVQNPVHSYTATGNYTITLTVTSDSGCTATFSDTLTTCTSVQAGFTYSSTICQGQTVNFTDTSVVAVGDSLISWNWNFGDGGTDTVQNPSHAYLNAGTYTVTLVVGTLFGSSDSASQIVLVNPMPVASFSFISTCGLDSVYFTDLSTLSGGTITSWNWNFGDGNTSTQQNPVHYYDSTGIYAVNLTVTSDSGCSMVFADSVNPFPGITAAFMDSMDCAMTVHLTDQTALSLPYDSIMTWNWSFGDSGTDTVQNPSHTYASAGTYVIQLIVNGLGGCVDTLTDTVNVVAPPVADFTPPGGSFYAGNPINFNELATNDFMWDWDFGDGNGTTQQNPTHMYPHPGTYTVVLIVDNGNGCFDTAAKIFDIDEKVVDVPTAFTPNGDGINDQLYVRGGPLKEMDFRIYNEWGNEVFRSTDQQVGWDGKYKGKDQSAARFVYILKYVTEEGVAGEMSGDVTILR